MLKSWGGVVGVGGPSDNCVSPSPFGLDFGTSDLGLTLLNARSIFFLFFKGPYFFNYKNYNIPNH